MTEIELLIDIRELLAYILLVASAIWETSLVRLFRR